MMEQRVHINKFLKRQTPEHTDHRLRHSAIIVPTHPHVLKILQVCAPQMG